MPLSNQQLLERKNKLGATDICTILNLSPFQTAMDVFLEKTNQSFPKEQTDAQLLGTLLEPCVGKYYEKIHNLKLTECIETLYHPDYSFIVGHPDFLAEDIPRIIEVKTTNLYMMSHWKDELGNFRPPDYVVAQLQIYLGLANIEEGDIAVLFGTRDYEEFNITLDRELFHDMIKYANYFWNTNIIKRVPPDPQSINDEESYLKVVFKEHDNRLIQSTPELDILAHTLYEKKELLKTLKLENQDLTNKLKEATGNALGIQGSDWKFTWKKTKGSGTDWQALAQTFLPSEQLIEQFAKSGYRRALFQMKGKEDEE